MTETTGAMVTRQGFDHQESKAMVETSSTAMAEAAKARVQSAHIMARQFPRDMRRVRERILDACGRPRFAEGAVYALPRKSWNPETRQKENIEIRGLSVRFAEEAARALGNLDIQEQVIYEDDRKLIVQVTVLDLEANLSTSDSVVVSKTIERKQLREWEEALEVRAGASGKVFVVSASDGDVRMKRQSEVARVRRNLILAQLPSDIREEAEDAIEATKRDADRSTSLPKKREEIRIGMTERMQIPQDQIETFIGRTFEEMGVDDLRRLIEVVNSIKDGVQSWDAIFAEFGGSGSAEGEAPESGGEERVDLVKKVAAVKASDPDLYKAACSALGASTRKNPENMDDEELRMLAEQIEDERSGGEGEAPDHE